MTSYYLILFLLHFITYWTMCLFFLIADWFYLDKLHVNWKKYPKAFKTSLTNQLAVSLPTIYLFDDLIISSIDINPSSWFFYGFKIFLIVNLSNLFFYTTHRLLHTRWFFNQIHYKHHKFVEPIACATLYAHPVEHLFANILSFILPIIIVGTTFNTIVCLLVAGTIVSTIAHVKYKILPTTNGHLVHHQLFKYNYGFGNYLDKLLGTYK